MTVNLKVALQSDAQVALHIRNIRNFGNISINVPIQYIVTPRNIGGDLTEAVLISNLRQCAATALLENQPNEPLPAHLLTCFELSSYRSKDGITLSSVHNTLSQVLESSVSMRNHGDEGVALHIFCAFSSRCHSSYVRTNNGRLRASAAATGEGERKRLAKYLKGWAAKKKRVVKDTMGIEREYVAIPYANNPHPLRSLRDRVVDSIVPEGMDEKEFIQIKGDEVMHFVEAAVNYLIEGAVMTSEKFWHYTTPFHFGTVSDTSVVSREESNECKVDDEASATGVEIILDSDENTIPSSEWNVIFDLDVSDNDSMGSMVVTMVSHDSAAAISSIDYELVAESSENSNTINSPEDSIIEIETDTLINVPKTDMSEVSTAIDVPVGNLLFESNEEVGPAIDTQFDNLLSESDDDGLVVNLDDIKSYSSSERTTPKNNTTSDENLSFDSCLSSVGGISIDDDSSWAVLDNENGE